MKKIVLLLQMILLAHVVVGQEEKYPENGEIKTIFDNDNTIGGYGGIDIGYSLINKTDAVTIGGRGAMIAGHTLALGFAGKGFITNYFPADNNQDALLTGGYGGLLIEPILFPKFPVHLSIPIVVGAGGIAYAYNNTMNDWDNYVDQTSAYFVVEPGAELEFNLTRFMRLALGAYYRYTSKIEIRDIEEDALQGFSAGLSVKIGVF